MRGSSETGSHVLFFAFALLVLALAAVGFAGYRVFTMQQGSGASTATVPAKITNTASLKQAATVLDQSSAQLNAGLDDSGLNTALKDLL